MNFKQIIRSIKLSVILNEPLTGEVSEIVSFLNDNLSNLNTFKNDTYPDYIFYGKDKDSLLFFQDIKNGCCYVHNDKIWSVFESKLNMQHTDIQQLMTWYIGNIYQIDVVNTNTCYISNSEVIGNTYQIEINNA